MDVQPLRLARCVDRDVGDAPDTPAFHPADRELRARPGPKDRAGSVREPVRGVEHHMLARHGEEVELAGQRHDQPEHGHFVEQCVEPRAGTGFAVHARDERFAGRRDLAQLRDDLLLLLRPSNCHKPNLSR